MILETLDGRSEVVDVEPGRAVYVPGNWVHRSVNVGPERFSTLFCYAADAGQDYAIIERAGGMASLVVVDGDGYAVRPNPDHRGYSARDGTLPRDHQPRPRNHRRQGNPGRRGRTGRRCLHCRVRHRLRTAGQGGAGRRGLVGRALSGHPRPDRPSRTWIRAASRRCRSRVR